ncbi:MAG: serine hydrolase domain-containing protein, partial [Bacteroidales bacterium]
RTRLFEPLGMTHTSWRDEYRRIVKGRAIGYDLKDGNYLLDMPFEDVHGNGGLLTTVGDLLRWNENFVNPKVGDEQFLREEQTPGRFNDGRAHDYALGLYVRQYKAVREVGHGGATAGYRAYLARYPEQHVSVAVLCNAGAASFAERYAHGVADLYLGEAIKPKPVPGGNPIANDDRPITDAMKARAGLYRNTLTGAPLIIEASGPRFLLSTGGPATEIFWESDSTMTTRNGERHFEFDATGLLSAMAENGTKQTYERVEPVRPTPSQLNAYEGTYWSDDAETLLTVVLEGDELKVTRRPDTRIAMKPLYRDAFVAPGLGLIRFRRNAQNRVAGLSIVLDRVWDMRFQRTEAKRPGT